MKKKFRTPFIPSALTAVTLAIGLFATPTFAMGWQKDASGWMYYVNKDNTDWYCNSWQWLDGNNDGIAECYCFDPVGYLYTNTTTPDGYTVNTDGAWTLNNIVQTKTISYESVNSSSSSDKLGSGSTKDFANEMIDLINKDRVAYGEKKLESDDILMEFAAIRAEEISRKFSHTRPDGSNCTDELKSLYGGLYGENAFTGCSDGPVSPEMAESAFMNSTGHKKNILYSSYASVGVGVYELNGRYYYVQIFKVNTSNTSKKHNKYSSLTYDDFQSWAQEEENLDDEYVSANNIKFLRPGDDGYDELDSLFTD